LTGTEGYAANLVVALPYADLPNNTSDFGAMVVNLSAIAGTPPQNCAGLIPPPDASFPPPLKVISLIVATNNLADGGPAVDAGVYPIHPQGVTVDGGLNASVDWGTTGTSVGGSVTVQAIGPTTVDGTFSTALVLDGGTSPIAGSFHAEVCLP
jgi:hypothetical protein